MVKLVSFVPFTDAAHALEVANDVSEGERFFRANLAAGSETRTHTCPTMQVSSTNSCTACSS